MYSNIKDYSPKWKTKRKSKKEKLQERSREYYRNFSEDKKAKRIMLAVKTKIADEDREMKKYIRNYYYKSKII